MGVDVMQTKNEMFLERSAYTKALLSRLGMDKANSVATPVDINADPVTTSDEVEECDKDLYQSAVGETDIYTFGTQVCFRRKETHLTQRDFDCSSTTLAAALSTINDRVRHCIQNNVRIRLITDGHHNCGGSPDHKIAQMSVPFGKTVEVYMLGEGQSYPVQYSVDIRSGLHNGSASCPTIFWDRYSSDAEVLDEMKKICEEIVTGMVKVKLSLPGKVVPLIEETKLESRGGEYVYYETDPEQLISTLKFTSEDGVHIPLQVSAAFCILINALIVDHTCHLAALTYVWMKTIRDYPAINRPQFFEKRISDLEATAKIYMDRPGIVNYVSSLVKDPPQALMTESGPFNNGVLNCGEKVPTVCAVHCVLRRQHLVAKNLSGELHEPLKVCIRSINKIKAHPLNCRLFAKLCEENDETFNQLLCTLK
ncbi:hypothetical protein FHG87_021106 [Trinorchestia longiramus]|nr:hypothetical protein FHG87_021106 [Trinorchestia longiramus]